MILACSTAKAWASRVQAGHVALAGHAVGVQHAVFGAPQVFQGHRDLAIGVLNLLDVVALDEFLHGDLGRGEALFGLDLGRLGLGIGDLLRVDLVFDRRRVEPDQIVPFVDAGAVLDQPQDRAAAGDLALHVDVARALDIAVFGDDDHHVAARDFLGQLAATRAGVAVSAEQKVRARQDDDPHARGQQPPPGKSAAAARFRGLVPTGQDFGNADFGCHKQGLDGKESQDAAGSAGTPAGTLALSIRRAAAASSHRSRNALRPNPPQAYTWPDPCGLRRSLRDRASAVVRRGGTCPLGACNRLGEGG